MPRPRPVVFLIDSDEETRVTHETILRNDGYEILSAPDGAQALEQVREQAPALLLVGARIGHMSALQLVRMVKTDATLRAVRVLVYTASSTDASKDDLMRAGADTVLVSPIAPQQLVKEVVNLIGRA